MKRVVVGLMLWIGLGWNVGIASAEAGGPAAVTPAAASSSLFKLPPLPYEQTALEPYISAKTLSFHYGKHHQAYVDNLNKLLLNSPLASSTLEKIIQTTSTQPEQTAIFNNAAQVWNHTFFWKSMKPKGPNQPSARMLAYINRSFGSYAEFEKEFMAAATSLFGSGWVWLVQEGDKLLILKTANADTPVAHGQSALLTCDVWEHAYYLEYQNRRGDFVQAYLQHLINWEFAESNLK
jgi:superoxide dismutase, Fe-Mn family